MSNKYGAQRITCEVGGKVCDFRSKLEYRYGVYLEVLKQSGHIREWEHEPPDMAIEFQYGRRGNTRGYLPDFLVLTTEGVNEVHETKGAFLPIDYTKIKKYSEMHDNPIVLIFANLTDCKSLRKQYNRAMRIEKHIKRVIYHANRDIFKKISHLFEV